MRQRTSCAPAVVLAACAWIFATGETARAQVLVSDTAVGYIDPAIPMNQVRLRFDAAYGTDFPDRAEFFYGAWGRSGPGAPGPPLRERNVDRQELTAYLELAPWENVSGFLEAPFRWINPDINQNAEGFGDLNVGAKWAFLQTDWSLLSLQFRTYVPTGDADAGLGTEHVSLEPGVLGVVRVTERLMAEGELRHWIPVGGTDGFAGNVLRYGLGLSYLAEETPVLSVRPVAEFVGWSVLDGQKSSLAGVTDADGDTIVNVKAGVRVGLGPSDPLYGQGRSIYAGYGRAVTGHVWYEDVFRVEYRQAF